MRAYIRKSFRHREKICTFRWIIQPPYWPCTWNRNLHKVNPQEGIFLTHWEKVNEHNMTILSSSEGYKSYPLLKCAEMAGVATQATIFYNISPLLTIFYRLPFLNVAASKREKLVMVKLLTGEYWVENRGLQQPLLDVSCSHNRENADKTYHPHSSSFFFAIVAAFDVDNLQWNRWQWGLENVRPALKNVNSYLDLLAAVTAEGLIWVFWLGKNNKDSCW